MDANTGVGSTHRVLSAVGLLAVATVSVAGASWWSAGRVERNLATRAQTALDATGLRGTVTFDGRDAVLAGTASDAQQSRLATTVIGDLWGVRRVTSSIAVSPTPTPTRSPEPTPLPTPRPTPTPTPVVVWPAGSIAFASGRADLSPSARTYLDRVSSYLVQTPRVVVRIRGYTDSVGPPQYNRALSQRRADIVAAYLTRRGVGTSRLRTEAYGADEPVTSNDTSTGRSVNRRVELLFREGT